MKHFYTLMIGLLAGSALAQNYGTPAAQGNAADNDNSGLQQLSPAQRAGRRGGVFVLGSTNPYSLGLSNNAGAAGSNVRTNSGFGSSSNRASIVVTNSNGLVTTNIITDVPPSQVVYPPPVVPGPVPPGTGAPGPRVNPGTGINPAAGTRAGESIVLPPEGVVAPPPAAGPPPGITPAPAGETALPPGGTATAPQGTPAPPPPPIAPARTR